MATPDYLRDPWNVAVPVKRSNFVATHRRWARYNVEVDLATISAFKVNTDFTDPEKSLWCDRQLNCDINSLSRMGSGRSGFFDGYYLKGVGRTLLAANWNGQDHLHNSGHLPASAAIREYAVSQYFKALGKQHWIVPCEAILIRPLNRSLRTYSRLMAKSRSQPGYRPAVDDYLQALTIKPGNFCRYSNLAWLLSHPHPSELRNFFLLLGRKLMVAGESPTSTDPDLLARALVMAIEQGGMTFERFFDLGVHWGSFHNNFTLDGRFLDLEMPLILGNPLIGVSASKEATATHPAQWIGWDMVFYARQVSIFLKFLIARLTWIMDFSPNLSPVEIDFGRQFTRAITRALGREHWLFSTKALTQRLVKHAESSFALSHWDRKNFLKVAIFLRNSDTYASPEEAKVRRWLSGFNAEKFAFAPVEAFSSLRLFSRNSLRAAQTADHAWHRRREEAAWVNEQILMLDSITDQDRLLEALSRFSILIHREVRSLSD